MSGNDLPVLLFKMMLVSGDLGCQQYLPPSEVAHLTWVSTDDVDTDLQLSSPALADGHLEAPGSNLESQSAKRRRIPSPWRYNGDLIFNHNDVDVEEHHQL